tara:strand:- start:602 stop:1075 length:474 start_codon:yes stop_codon:yes gene_type:complete
MKKRVVRESNEIYLSEYGQRYSEGIKTLERVFGRQRTLQTMIKRRESKKLNLDEQKLKLDKEKQKLDDEIQTINEELQERTKQIKELSKFMSPSISIVSPNKKDKYKRYRCKVYLSFGNKKSRYMWINLGTEEMLKDYSKDELRELGRREFLRKIGQ